VQLRPSETARNSTNHPPALVSSYTPTQCVNNSARYTYPLYTALLSDSRCIRIPEITQVRPWVSHRAAWAHIFSTISDSV